MKYGKLYGVGVGPGACDLMTLRAVRVLREVPVIAIPQRSRWDESVAWRIAAAPVGAVAGQERLFLTFPMTKNPQHIAPAWDTAFTQIGQRLEAGKSVAFIAEGDPLFYSTFIYLHQQAPTRWPGIEIEIVPGVSSISAVAAVTSDPIADGQERVAIIPASYGLDDLPDILERFDTVLLLKVSSVMPRVVAALEKADLIDRAVYVSKATMADQKIVPDLRSIRNDRCDYFSMVVVSRKHRNGVLAGRGRAAVGAPRKVDMDSSLLTAER